MGLNEQKGNMYGFVTHTWNTVKGVCPHDCTYCYMKRFKNQKPARFDKSELSTDLGDDYFIFVGSSNDMFADEMDTGWITETLAHCRDYPYNKYLFQTKNPKRFEEFLPQMPRYTTLCATIESNHDHLGISRAPYVDERRSWMKRYQRNSRYKIMITIEPVMEFHPKDFYWMLRDINPDQVNIGANTSYEVKLPEPSRKDLEWLIEVLKGFTEVHLKQNLRRLLR